MREYAAEILLWLFVINLGIAFGAGLYEKRVSVPEWFPASSEAGRRVNREAMRQADAGRRFWAYVTTGPLTVLALGNLAPLRDGEPSGLERGNVVHPIAHHGHEESPRLQRLHEAALALGRDALKTVKTLPMTMLRYDRDEVAPAGAARADISGPGPRPGRA